MQEFFPPVYDPGIYADGDTADLNDAALKEKIRRCSINSKKRIPPLHPIQNLSPLYCISDTGSKVFFLFTGCGISWDRLLCHSLVLPKIIAAV